MKPQMLSIFVLMVVMSLTGVAHAQCNNPPLPCQDVGSSDSTLFSITNTGTGSAGFFGINNGSSSAAALIASTKGRGPALLVRSIGLGIIPLPKFTNTAFRATTSRIDGRAGLFEITRSQNSSPAVEATTASTSAEAIGILGVVSSDLAGPQSAAVRGISKSQFIPGAEDQGKPIGIWGSQEGHGFGVVGDSKSGVGVLGEGRTGVEGIGITGILGRGGSRGHGVLGINTNLVGSAGTFVKGFAAAPTTKAAVQIVNNMGGGEAAWIALTAPRNPAPVMKLLLPRDSGSNFIEGYKPDGARKFRINSKGTFISGSDFAEAMPAHGRMEDYEPGDVLVLASDGSGVKKTSELCSNRIIGVYSTRPGILGADKNGETRVDPDDLPVAILGIVPTKVTTQNGSIHIGDLLVTSSTPGHAMKAKPKKTNGIETYPTGAILGKALETWEEGTGMIKVLVMLR